MNKFEGVQSLILSSVDKNQLVSAGAGSGKTTIMVEKILELILQDKVKVENLLVVTFTVLAAGEMKERLIKRLENELENTENKDKILENIEKIKTASIDTIDGFASKTIKKYFYELEISPNIEIISDATRDYYLTLAMKKTIEKFSKNENIGILLDVFGGNKRNFEPLENLILETYNNIINLEDYDTFLTKARNEYLNGLKSENVVNMHICSNANKLKKIIIESIPAVESGVGEKLKNFEKTLENFNEKMSLNYNLQILFSMVEPSFSSKETKDNQILGEVKSEIKDFFEIRKTLKENSLDENFELKNEKILPLFDNFVEILREFIENYKKIKEKNDLIDFNDLNRLMLKLLSNEKIATELKNKYTHIFIDEYQDVNPLQDKLLSAIVGENTTVFMVGDVKQSIYGFRGASPEWFLKKYHHYKTKSDSGAVFDMNVNFRSNPVILNFINQVFSRLMTEQTSDIDYKRDCMIEPKQEIFDTDKVKIRLFSNKDEDKEFEHGIYSVKNHKNEIQNSVKLRQANFVAKTITELLNQEIFDLKSGQKRPIRYSDIAILSRSEKDDDILNLIDVLKSNAIPVSVNNSLNMRGEGVKLILSILKCLIGVADDVDLTACFMSIGGASVDDVVRLRDKEKTFRQNLEDNLQDKLVLSFFEKLNLIKEKSYTMSNDELIRLILNDMKLKYFILRKEEGSKQVDLIEEFLQKLSPIECGLGIYEFIQMLESNVNKNSDFQTQDNENSVTIQTIHKSKGLEYPIVILYNTGKTFLYTKHNETINFNSQIGLGFDFYDTTERTKSFSLPKYAIQIQNDLKSYKEELRLLYVAMTRAKNKLFVVGTYSPNSLSSNLIKTSYSNMLLSLFLNNIIDGHFENDVCDFSLIENEDECIQEKNSNFEKITWENREFSYNFSEKFNIPFKNTVTGLNSMQNQNNKFESKKVFTAGVQIDSEEDKALVGVHYHSALEKLDFSKEYEKNTDYNDVDYGKIQLAHKILSGITKNAKLHKEAMFTMYVPYNQIVESDFDDKVLVQGVVDLIIERENSIDIVDYKFSKLSVKKLKEKYAEQLKLYKLAVESAFSKKVEHMYIYSVNTGELV